MRDAAACRTREEEQQQEEQEEQGHEEEEEEKKKKKRTRRKEQEEEDEEEDGLHTGLTLDRAPRSRVLVLTRVRGFASAHPHQNRKGRPDPDDGQTPPRTGQPIVNEL